MSTRKKSYSRMTVPELAAATADLDRELVVDEFRESTPRERDRWLRARRRRGRPRKGRGAKAISVTIERTLLARSDALAERLGISRAGLVERGLRAVLAAQGEI